MKIFYYTLGNFKQAGSRNRVFYIAKELPKYGIKTKILSRRSNKFNFLDMIQRYLLFPFMAFNYNIVYFQKTTNPMVKYFISWFKFIGIKTVFDWDDSLYLYREKEVHQILKRADLIICGSHHLMDYSKKFNENVTLLPTSMNVEMYQPMKVKKDDIFTIGWVGNGYTYQDDLLVLFNPIKELSQKYKIRFTIIGTKNAHKLSKFREIKSLDLKLIDWIDAEKIPEEISKFDVGIMPLTDTLQTRGKCVGKGLEYMAMGIPAVVSAIGENNYAIENGVNGFLCKDENDWVKNIEKLIKDKNLREKFSEEGRKTFEEKYSNVVMAKRLAKILKE